MRLGWRIEKTYNLETFPRCLAVSELRDLILYGRLEGMLARSWVVVFCLVIQACASVNMIKNR